MTQELMAFDSQTAPVEFRRSPRARRLSVRVFVTGRAEVVVPLRITDSAARAFLDRHSEWIASRRTAASRDRPREQAFPPANIALPAFGEQWRVHLAAGDGRLRVVPHANGLLEIRGIPNASNAMRVLLRAWIVSRTRERVAPQVFELANSLGLPFRRLTVRRQRTRWGSCSARGTISLNSCIAFQRVEVARYLMLHELAHTRHMNHSPRFWALVAQHCPDWRRLDRELNEGWRNVPGWMFGSLE